MRHTIGNQCAFNIFIIILFIAENIGHFAPGFFNNYLYRRNIAIFTFTATKSMRSKTTFRHTHTTTYTTSYTYIFHK